MAPITPACGRVRAALGSQNRSPRRAGAPTTPNAEAASSARTRAAERHGAVLLRGPEEQRAQHRGGESTQLTPCAPLVLVPARSQSRTHARAAQRPPLPSLSLVCVRSAQSTPPHTHTPRTPICIWRCSTTHTLTPHPQVPPDGHAGAHAAACAVCVERRIHPEQTQQETCKRNGQRPALLSYQSELGSARELPLTPWSRLRGRGSLLRFLLPWSSQRGRTPAHRNRAPAPDSRVRRAKRN